MKSKQTSSKKPLSPFISPFLSPGRQRPQDDSSMDWSLDIPEVQDSPQQCVPPAGGHVSSPHVPLLDRDSSGDNRAEPSNSGPSVLNYGNNQPSIASSWDGAYYALSVFRTEKSASTDAANINLSIKRIVDYIKHHHADDNPPAGDFIPVVNFLWKLIDMIYASKWNLFYFDSDLSLNIHKCVGDMILPKYRKSNSAMVKENLTVSNPPTTITPSVVVSPPLTSNTPMAPPNKIIGSIEKKAPKPSNAKKSYVQASKANISSNIEDVLCVKKPFPSLSVDEVGKMLKAKNSGKGNKKPRINMITRRPSRREVIISMTKPNAELIVHSAHIHTSNINKCLKNSKSDIIADFIHITNNGIIITTNKLVNNLDLSTIKKCLKQKC